MKLKNRANLPLDHPDYEGDGRGLIVVTLTAALLTLAIILGKLLTIVPKMIGSVHRTKD